jgi:hypothetical protein
MDSIKRQAGGYGDSTAKQWIGVLLLRYVLSTGNNVSAIAFQGRRRAFITVTFFPVAPGVIVENANLATLSFAVLHECALHCVCFKTSK